MEPDKTTPTEEPVNGAAQAEDEAPEANSRAQHYAHEASVAYERARQQMNEAVSRLRTEIDHLEMDRAALRAQSWVRENATLATFLALGGGILVGRLIASALTPPPPPPLPVRLRNRALDASRHVGRAAKKGAAAAGGAAVLAGGTLAHEASEAGEALARHARRFGNTAGHHAADYFGDAGHRLSDFGHQAAGRAAALNEVLSNRAHDAVSAFEDATEDVTDVVRKKAHEGVDLAETAFNTAKAVAAAVLVKKVNDIVRRVF